jgi:hypothetical protein
MNKDLFVAYIEKKILRYDELLFHSLRRHGETYETSAYRARIAELEEIHFHINDGEFEGVNPEGSPK